MAPQLARYRNWASRRGRKNAKRFPVTIGVGAEYSPVHGGRITLALVDDLGRSADLELDREEARGLLEQLAEQLQFVDHHRAQDIADRVEGGGK